MQWATTVREQIYFNGGSVADLLGNAAYWHSHDTATPEEVRSYTDRWVRVPSDLVKVFALVFGARRFAQLATCLDEAAPHARVKALHVTARGQSADFLETASRRGLPAEIIAVASAPPHRIIEIQSQGTPSSKSCSSPASFPAMGATVFSRWNAASISAPSHVTSPVR